MWSALSTQGFWKEALFFFEAGGYVMPPLVAATILLWFGIGYRASALRRGRGRSVREMIEAFEKGERDRARGIVEEAAMRGVALWRRGLPNLRRHLDDAFMPYYGELKRYTVLIKTIVAVAPLLGLLGTVVGMIETFNSLGDMSLFAQSGGIAGGISQALFTTQLGLAVAIPGMVVNGFMDRKQQSIEMELDQLKDALCSRAPAPRAQEEV